MTQKPKRKENKIAHDIITISHCHVSLDLLPHKFIFFLNDGIVHISFLCENAKDNAIEQDDEGDYNL